jgi:translation initiation factor 1
MSREPSRTVWSSEAGDLRKEKQPAVATPIPAAAQTIYLHRESKGRGGKPVTILRGFTLPEKDLAALAKSLKQSLGVGGTVKENSIEIQSQERERIAALLQKSGFRAKLAGG